MNKKHALQLAIMVILMAVLLGSQQVVKANTRVPGAGEVPFYARLERAHLETDGTWVPVAFYRRPECIPADFNLLDLFDFANCWSCQPITTDGFAIWKTFDDPAPMLQVLQGLGAVPVWFVSLDEYEAAIADDHLTIGELAALPSRRTGYASFYQETLRPEGGSAKTMMTIEARGNLADGSTFNLHMLHTDAHSHVVISMRD